MRRVITGVDENGKSAVIYDGPPQSVYLTTNAKVGSLQIESVAGVFEDVMPGQACIVGLWEADGPPRPDSPDLLDSPQKFEIEPPGTGFRIRYFNWGANLDSSAMHTTDTFDLNYVISGEVELLLEEGRSVTLRAGDTVVTPGNLHGWRAGPEGVRMINFMQKLA